MKTFINCTKHNINMNDGTVYQPSGMVANVSASFSPIDENGIAHQVFGDVVGLPEPQPDTFYIVSSVVMTALAGTRPDCVAPATGHPDCIRENGIVKSVPCFVQ